MYLNVSNELMDFCTQIANHSTYTVSPSLQQTLTNSDWLSIPEETAYEKLMVDVEKFIDNPGEKDVKVSEVFTEAMFEKLDKRLVEVGWKSMRTYWEDDFSKRTIVSGFLKDKTLGSKRLASMPDRYTNLINTSDGKTAFRPTIISMYEGDLGSQEKWWSAWEAFMFDTTLLVDNDKKPVWSLLKPIKKAKYKDITEQEEADSLPLSTMCCAIMDAIFVHTMNSVSTPDVWQPLKRKLVDSLSKRKVENTLKILQRKYLESDIITLQEVSLAMIEKARKMDKLGDDYVIVAPKELDAIRDQNSVIFLKKTTFPHGSLGEITDEVEAAFPPDEKVPVAKGDINAITTVDAEGVPYVVVSFHGDTNGLATKPVLDAVLAAMKNNRKLRNHRLIFGLDANTYEKGTADTQDVTEWAAHYTSHGLTSCWGDTPNPKNYTTYNARTFLQPQLNKACRKDESCGKADINPKDFILFPKADYRVVKTWKDNTGQKTYTENMAFPTLKFPSDHGILATVIAPAADA